MIIVSCGGLIDLPDCPDEEGIETAVWEHIDSRSNTD